MCTTVFPTGAGVYLDSVSVREGEEAESEYLFPVNNWLDDHIGDKKTHRQLKLLGKFNKLSNIYHPCERNGKKKEEKEDGEMIIV